MQLLGGDLPALAEQGGQDGDTAVDGFVDGDLVGLAGTAEHEVDDAVLEVEGARVADAQAQSPVGGGAEVGGDVAQAVVGAGAAFLEAGAAGQQVEFVEDDEDVGGVEAVEAGQRADGLAGAVHVGHGLEQAHDLAADADFADFAVVSGVVADLAGVAAQQGVDEPEAGVVAVGGVFGGGVAEADDQAGGAHGGREGAVLRGQAGCQGAQGARGRMHNGPTGGPWREAARAALRWSAWRWPVSRGLRGRARMQGPAIGRRVGRTYFFSPSVSAAASSSPPASEAPTRVAEASTGSVSGAMCGTTPLGSLMLLRWME